MNKSKILEDENFRLTIENMLHYDNQTVNDAYNKYKYFGILIASDVIKEEGSINKECEYNVLFYDNHNDNNGGKIMNSFVFFTLLYLLLG